MKIGSEGGEASETRSHLERPSLYVYLKIGTKPEYECLYLKDFREAKEEEPSATSDGRWFKWLGEQQGVRQ